MSNQLTPQLSSDSSPGQASSLGLKPSHDPMLTSPPASSAGKGLEDNKDGYNLKENVFYFLTRYLSPNTPTLPPSSSSFFFFYPSAIALDLPAPSPSSLSYCLVSLCSSVKSCLLLTSASKIEPMKALDSRFTERSKATPGVTVVLSSTAGIMPLDR